MNETMSNDGTGLREAWIAGYKQGAHDHADCRLIQSELDDDAEHAADHALSAVAPPCMALIGEAQIRAENEALTGCTWFRSAIPPGTPIYAASPAAPAQQAWQPIETAPKDGATEYLFFHAKWGELTIGIRPLDCPDDAACTVEGIACYPSHWMPLPTPPALTSTAAKAADLTENDKLMLSMKG